MLSLCVCLAALVAVVTAPNPAPWLPPAQSTAQAEVFARAQAAAEVASAAAKPALLQALALPGVVAALHDCGAPSLSPQQLLDRIDSEVAVTEVVHNFAGQRTTPSDSFLYNLWEYPLLPPFRGGDNNGHDCYAITDLLGGNSTECTDYGWQQAQPSYGLPEVPRCKFLSSAQMCVPTDSAGLELVETGLYSFPKFKTRGAPENFQAASSRPIYAAANIQRLDTGSSPTFGPVGVVFAPSFIRNMTQLAPTDTGLYAGCLAEARPDWIDPSGFAICSEQQNASCCTSRTNCDWQGTRIINSSGATTENYTCADIFCPHFSSAATCKSNAAIGCQWHLLDKRCEQISKGTTQDGGLDATSTTTSAAELAAATLRQRLSHVDQRAESNKAGPVPWSTPPRLGCAGWDRTVGTLDHYYHLFLPNARLWANSSGSDISVQSQLGNRLCRLLSPSTMQLTGIETLHYWEAAVGGTPVYPQAVKMIIGDFAELFGTPRGQALREWCIQRKWVLAWALGAAGQSVMAEWCVASTP